MKETIKTKIGILVENKGKLLLIKELNSKDSKYYWNIIKGTFEPDKDDNFLESAKRECKEEAGIDVKITGLLNIIYLSDRIKNKFVIQFNFIAAIEKGTPQLASKDEQQGRSEDIIELRYFTKNDLKKTKKDEFMNERAYLVVSEWLKNIKHETNIFKFISKK
ncbi:MAG: NUDIX hydrolase [Nanoarchaeota archaeon]|nr:NUDIX hydrolase [Nanoarchaeota archaeon]